ncbi:hypothetical protein Klosneuvirus_1_385 [Klosneuvirus KNV1]|uniref:Uncharacterized protein n=1 Tax=Klosneuvirus KNV1 TaxID=1977640 RepID=A0A1V0SIR8_9VIRU|nr:hypothetical protein Klosneuvirus_1_385 [Klosneuvirus KNV1]
MADLSQSAFILDQSVINYGRITSLETLRQNPNYLFNQHSISVETMPNTGRFEDERIEYTNKCFFIALSQGLELLQRKLEPIILMQLANFMDKNKDIYLETNIHMEVKQQNQHIYRLAEFLTDVQIYIYVGHKKDEKWHIIPDHHDTFGQGPTIIRILNKGNYHYELITTDTNMFPREIKTMTPEKAQLHQHEVMQMIKQKEEDYLLAKWLAENDD